MSSGQHKATVILDGKSDGLNKAAKSASNRVGVLESVVEKLQAELAKATQRLDAQSAALDKSKQRLKEQSDAARTAAERQAELTKQAKAQAEAHSKALATISQAGTRSSFSSEKQLGGLERAYTRVRQAAADYMIIGRGAWDIAMQGAQALSALAERATMTNNVIGNLPFSIDKARSATRGLVSDTDLARTAQTLFSTGVVDSAPRFAELAQAAQALGARVGLDGAATFDSLTAALARGSTEMLDNLGIVLKQEQAYREYAASLGKSVNALTETEKAEAFREVAMRKIIEAARDIKVDTDSAGAAVKRFENDLDRLANKALGGEQATTTLRKGLQQVALQFRESGRGVGAYGVEADKLRDMLRDLNVGTDELAVSNAQLGRELDKVRKEELGRIERMIFQGEATAENIEQLEFLRRALGDAGMVGATAVDAAIERQKEEALAARQARQSLDGELEALQLSIAYLEGKGDEEKLLNAAIREEMELRARILEMEGKSVDAAKLRRDIEVQAQRQAGQADRVRRGGGGRRRDVVFDMDAVLGNTEAVLRRIEGQERRAFAAMERTGAGAQERWKRLAAEIERGERAMADLQELLDRLDERATPDPFSLESFAAVRAREQDLAAANDEIYLNRQRRSASGIEDPLARMEAETQARLAHLDARQQAANDTIEILRLEDEREAAVHELKMARLEEEKQRRAEMLAQRVAIAEETADLMMGVATVALRAAFLEEGSIRKKVAAVAKANAFEMLAVQAPAETLRGLIAAASYNVPKAALHFANAGKAAALGGSMLAIAGAAGGLGRTAAPATGAGFGASTGTGGGFGGGSGGGGSPRSGGSSSQIPESEEPTFRRAAAPAAGAGGPVLNITIQGDVIGTPKKEFYREVDRGLRDLGYSSRRAG